MDKRGILALLISVLFCLLISGSAFAQQVSNVSGSLVLADDSADKHDSDDDKDDDKGDKKDEGHK